MIKTKGWVLRLVMVAAVTAVSGPLARAGEHEGTLVLKVDGKDVTLKLTGGSYGVGDEGKPDYFQIGGENVVLAGHFDLDRDGKADGKDKLGGTVEADPKPARMVNKPVLLVPSPAAKKSTLDAEEDDEGEGGGESPASFVVLPGLGRCAVLKGSTAVVARYSGSADNGRWSGTVSLKLATDKGRQKTVQGRFECGTGAE